MQVNDFLRKNKKIDSEIQAEKRRSNEINMRFVVVDFSITSAILVVIGLTVVIYQYDYGGYSEEAS